jgi:hypothetical protein
MDFLSLETSNRWGRSHHPHDAKSEGMLVSLRTPSVPPLEISSYRGQPSPRKRRMAPQSSHSSRPAGGPANRVAASAPSTPAPEPPETAAPEAGGQRLPTTLPPLNADVTLPPLNADVALPPLNEDAGLPPELPPLNEESAQPFLTETVME